MSLAQIEMSQVAAFANVQHPFVGYLGLGEIELGQVESYGGDDAPDLAVRDGKWKLLCEYDGSEAELYDLENDRGETKNLASMQKGIVASMAESVISWHQSLPPDNGPKLVKGR